MAIVMCEEWMKKGYLNKLWNGVHLEEEEKEDLEIRGCRKLQLEWERRELTTWNGSTWQNGEEKYNFKNRKNLFDILYIN
jgi:hypothetical protein